MIIKTIADSRSESVYLVLSEHLNGSGRLFGGILLQWIDTMGAVVARRHCGGEVTTASIDNLQFVAPVTINSAVVLQGHVTYVGNTSLEVCVESFDEALNGTRTLVNRAYLLFVALGPDGKPCRVPRIEPQNEQERLELEAGAARQQLRKSRRA